MTPEQRFKCMSHNRAKNTGPELKLRLALWRLGFRYRVNDKRLPGTPDIVLPKYHTVIFIHGCFWHGHRDCKFYTTPKTNTEFWTAKVARNQERDQVVWRQLEGVVGHYHLGMPAEEGSPGREYRPCQGGDSPERRALSFCPGGTSALTRSLQADAPAAAGEGSGSDGGTQATLIRHPSKLSQSFSFNGATLASDIFFSPYKRNPIPVKRNGIDQLLHVDPVVPLIKETE